ncbi:glycosyltransferase family 2 protein [Shinella zoogloeoides]|uniref:glycosyltransferase family 2 protein n=1 Tax=Shinella zoogloeoides TaxID=352475 RepID=UPI000E65BB37|nr:glycosyltransferase family 2 protein [Shinella zoogloeoides]WPE23345.1 Polyprenol monophosphomannose synthase [Shinella zoogloeoides]
MSDPVHSALRRSVRPAKPLGAISVPRVSVIVPTVNEAKNLPHVLPRIPGWVDEVILVDGNSADGTIDVALGLMPGIVVIEQPRLGKGAALAAGFAAARGDILITLDADGSADPAEMAGFVGALLAGADFVKGSRFLQGGDTRDMEWYRRIGNWGLLQLVRLRFGGRFSDLCYGYNAFWRDVLPHLRVEGATGFEIETHMNIRALQAGLAVAELPSREYPRVHGVSNLRTFPDGWRVLKTIARLGLARPAPVAVPLRNRSSLTG